MFKALDLWLPAYLRRRARPRVEGVTDILLAVCDHFEPLHAADKPTALRRLARWQNDFPKLIENFRDADGIRPRHTFFYPIEQYDADILAELKKLCDRSGGETEIHLHHDRDTADALRAKLEQGKRDFVRHGLLSRDDTGAVRYGFVHGNWALANSHPHGQSCGVNDELAVLRDTGCYADFTMPSCPNPTQTRTINSIYYAATTGQPKPHDHGELARTNSQLPTPNSQLLLIQGPLGLNWQRRKFGLLPKIENAEITGHNPPRPDRLKIWLDLGIHVAGRPEWIFIKLHTHGGHERDMATLLTDTMKNFFQHALNHYNDGQKFRFHFVSAREMVNIIHAAEDGKSGNAGDYRNHRYRLA
ncbi:MAG: hypothetical protein RLZZ350_847 [Verrucomicrobiota bacterium]|jgi:hypothetical protein